MVLLDDEFLCIIYRVKVFCACVEKVKLGTPKRDRYWGSIFQVLLLRFTVQYKTFKSLDTTSKVTWPHLTSNQQLSFSCFTLSAFFSPYTSKSFLIILKFYWKKDKSTKGRCSLWMFPTSSHSLRLFVFINFLQRKWN